MADMSQAIRDMLKSGMSESEVLDNLRQLGVSNPEETFKKATQTLNELTPKPPAPSLPVEVRPPSPAFSSDSDTKLDEILALLKAMQDVEKKILETNRDILLRLK